MVGKDDTQSLKFFDEFMALTSDPDFLLDGYIGCWEETKNPYYAWEAINTCAKHKRQFPTWVVDYLAQCAERMLSNKARQSNDVRKILPSVLGFRQFLLRGLDKVRGEWSLVTMAWNIKRMFTLSPA